MRFLPGGVSDGILLRQRRVCAGRRHILKKNYTGAALAAASYAAAAAVAAGMLNGISASAENAVQNNTAEAGNTDTGDGSLSDAEESLPAAPAADASEVYGSQQNPGILAVDGKGNTVQNPVDPSSVRLLPEDTAGTGSDAGKGTETETDGKAGTAASGVQIGADAAVSASAASEMSPEEIKRSDQTENTLTSDGSADLSVSSAGVTGRKTAVILMLAGAAAAVCAAAAAAVHIFRKKHRNRH